MVVSDGFSSAIQPPRYFRAANSKRRSLTSAHSHTSAKGVIEQIGLQRQPTPSLVLKLTGSCADNRGVSFAARKSSIATLSNSDLCALLEEAERDERLLSARRRELQMVIDNSAGGPDRDAHVQRERAISIERLDLHMRIAELRGEKSRRLTSLRAPLRSVS